ncbi:unnamed protein product [Paramecium octaurelia]|uniref:Uncharacterized protein n=1 Tax=Paramecium octaurelia TaxID=43137 RepID=A0A8S1SXS4_PAROT|nr:unnamed protein product [Paramecium octaurelia]
MQLDQETFNILFKEIFDLDSLPNKDREELTQQYQYYDNTMRKFLNALTINNQIMIMKLSYCIDLLPNLQRFIKQWWLKKSIFRSKASTFQPTIYNSLSNMYDSKQGIFISIIQSIFSECKLQIEIAHRKLTNDDIEKRIHSQDQGSQNNQYLQQSSQGSITQLLLQKKSPYPEWQINNMKNKNLSQYYKNLFKLYDLLLIDKQITIHITRMQEDQILYFQSKEQNLEKLYQQLIQQNTHIKKSFNWAATIDTNEFEKHNQQLQIKENLTIQNIQATTVNIIKTDQFDCQKTGISFLSSNEKYKVRSYSQNSKVKDLYSYSDKIKHFCPNYQESIKFRIPQSHLVNQLNIKYQNNLLQLICQQEKEF